MGFPQHFTLDLFGKDAKNVVTILVDAFPVATNHTAKDSQKSSLAGLLFHFAASIYPMVEPFIVNCESCGNDSFRVQGVGKVTATQVVHW